MPPRAQSPSSPTRRRDAVQAAFDNVWKPMTPLTRSTLDFNWMILEMLAQLDEEAHTKTGKRRRGYSDATIRKRLWECFDNLPCDEVPWHMFDQRQAWIKECAPCIQRVAQFFNDPVAVQAFINDMETLKTRIETFEKNLPTFKKNLLKALKKTSKKRV